MFLDLICISISNDVVVKHFGCPLRQEKTYHKSIEIHGSLMLDLIHVLAGFLRLRIVTLKILIFFQYGLTGFLLLMLITTILYTIKYWLRMFYP